MSDTPTPETDAEVRHWNCARIDFARRLERERDLWKAEAERWRDSKGWQPIETAPKDGTHILISTRAWDADDDIPLVRIVRWREASKYQKEHWELSQYDAFGTLPSEALFWMSLPEPPQ